jgi:hypothetical protein
MAINNTENRNPDGSLREISLPENSEEIKQLTPDQQTWRSGDTASETKQQPENPLEIQPIEELTIPDPSKVLEGSAQEPTPERVPEDSIERALIEESAGTARQAHDMMGEIIGETEEVK